jgi:A/G-specific adenine glycosylase
MGKKTAALKRRSVAAPRFSVGRRQASGAGDGVFAKSLDGLASWFERQKRVLPWRDHPSLYRVWVSEIMLQQTQVVTVVPYFERFMTRFPTVESLAEASEADVLLNWAGLGYYSRARNLHRGAQMIVAQGFPHTREGWLEIPGVGAYTAGAVLSIALDQPEAILDGNVERVVSRLRRVSRASGDTAYKVRLWRLSRALVEKAHQRRIRPSVLNQALMELGATTCTPRKPLCVFCPLTDLCRARAAGEQEAYPPRKKRKEWLLVKEELHCVLDGRGNVLLHQRQKGEWRAGLWDLPLEKPGVGALLQPVGEIETRHIVTRHKITRLTHVWRMTGAAGAEKKSRLLKASENQELNAATRWVSISKPEVASGSALKRTLQEIHERFPEVAPRN